MCLLCYLSVYLWLTLFAYCWWRNSVGVIPYRCLNCRLKVFLELNPDSYPISVIDVLFRSESILAALFSLNVFTNSLSVIPLACFFTAFTR